MGLSDALLIVLYISLIVFVISLTVFVIKLIGTVNKTNYLLDNLTKKAESLDKLFDIIDFTTNKFNQIGNTIVGYLMGAVNKIFGKRKARKKIMSKKSGMGKFILGAGLGAGLALLFAPQEGSKTRRELKIKFNELVEKAKLIDTDDVKADILQRVEELRMQVKDLDKEKALEIAKSQAKK